MSNKFDFSEDMDAAVSTAKELERTEQLIETLEGCKTALHELGTQADSLVREFSPLILALSSTVKAVKEAATVTVSAEARELLEREGLGICQRMLDEFEKRGERLVRQMAPVRNRTSVPTVAFWCMIEVIIFLLAAFICPCAANAQFIHSAVLWKTIGYTTGFLAVSVALTVLVCHKLKQQP